MVVSLSQLTLKDNILRVAKRCEKSFYVIEEEVDRQFSVDQS